MAEQRGSRGNGNGRSYGNNNHRSGGNGKGRGNAGRGNGHGGFRSGGRGGFNSRGGNGHSGNRPFRKGNGQRHERRDDANEEEGRPFRSDNRGGNGSFRSNNGHGGRGGNGHGNGGFERRDQRRFERRDGDDRRMHHSDEGGNRRFERDDRRHGNNDHRGQHGGSGERNFDRSKPRTGNKRYAQDHGRHDERREFSAEEKAQYREQKRQDYMSKSRRNSDGTVSFPSQNPYTARRPGEPKMPKGLEWSMLSREERDRLRGLSKEHADNIGLHILAAYTLEESDPQGALDHAKWVAKQASRVDFAREVLAFVAYRQGDYKLALREFKTAKRMNGYLDYLPFIADCERGLGEPKKAIEVATSDEAKQLTGEAKVEMFLVYAGALADLEMWNQAIEIVAKLAHSKGLPGEYRMRALQAEQYFLDESGRSDEAVALDEVIDRFEERYADVELDENSDDYVVDYDVEDLPEDLQAKLGVTLDDAQYAPYDGADSGVNMDDETRDDEEEQRAGAELDIEPALEMERNEEADEDGTMGDPDLDDVDDDLTRVGDVEEQIKSEME